MQITLDEGYQFGLGLFETVSVEQGTPLLLSWHLDRLRRSMEALGIQQEVDASQINSWLADQAKDQQTHHALKVIVSDANLLFTLRPNPYTPRRLREGFRLSYSSVYRNETSPLVRHKTLNYGDCILEKRRAKALGADELIFCNSRGEICEGTTTNIFFVNGGKLFTPPLSCGLLPGIMRRFILTYLPVTEQPLKRKDVPLMDECFVTNSLMGIMPVTALDEKMFPLSLSPGSVTASCQAAYRSFLQECLAERP